MKKFLMAVFVVIACLFLISGCGGDGENEVSTGGETITPPASAAIYGAEDVHIPLSATDISSEAYAIVNGERTEVNMDTTQVKFGTQGVYRVIYSAENVSETINVYVYSLPALTVPAEKVNCKYSEVWGKVYEDVTAEDCFGNALNVFISDDGGLFNSDGSLNTGEFVVEYCATDRAGQSVSEERTLTVEEEKNPALAAEYSFDVADESLTLSLSREDADDFLGISINGTALDGNEIVFDGLNVIVSGRTVNELTGGVGEANIRVMTKKGQTAAVLTVIDLKPVQLEIGELQEFTQSLKPCFESILLPKAAFINPYQQAEVKYFIDDGQNRIAAEETFVFQLAGDYEYVVSVRGNEYSFPVTAFYDLGLSYGKVYDGGFDHAIKDGYSLVEYRVGYANGGTTVLKYVTGSDIYGDLDKFKQDFEKLNSKYVYTLTTVCKRAVDGKLYSQTVSFVTAGGGTAILGAGVSGLYPAAPDKTALEYVNVEVFGKRGVYRWNTLEKNYPDYSSHENGVRLVWDENFSGLVTEGRYLTFDVCFTGAMLLRMRVKNGESTSLLNFWGRYLTSAPEAGASDEASHVFGNVAVYDAEGNKVSATSDIFRSPSCYGKWYTVTLKLKGDAVSSGGLTLHGQTDLFTSEVYLANMRISDEPPMSDDTVNPSVTADNEAVLPDVFGEFRE